MKALGKTVLHAAGQCFAGLADLLLPAVCGACGSGEVAADGLCQRCGRELLSMVALPYCPRCAATIGPNVPVRQDGCAACPTVLGRFAEVIRLGPYGPPLRSMIQQLKYHRQEVMLRRLGDLLCQAVAARADVETLDVVMPVPMHWRRRLARRYDHARAIAAELAGRLGLPLGDELVRAKYTPPQVQLPRTRRVEVIRGAFALRSNVAVRGAHVLLVDDVTTTGATASEAARTLLSGQASKVTLAVMAKAEPPTAYSKQLQ